MPSTTAAPRAWWLVGALVLAASVTIAGGVLARELYREPEVSAQPTPTRSPASTESPAEPPGPREVMLGADAAAHPQGDEVRELLQGYFDAINEGEYARWRTVVTRTWGRQVSRAQWEADYSSTLDGSIHVYRIERARGAELTVLVGFTSVQDIADAPPDFPHTCIRWRVVMPVVAEGGQLKLAEPLPGTRPEHDEC